MTIKWIANKVIGEMKQWSCRRANKAGTILQQRSLDSGTSTTTNFSNRQKGRASELASFWRENEIAGVILLPAFCENGVVSKTSPRNVGDLAFLESQKDLALIIQNNCVKFTANKE